jgi:alpha-L-fucosidase
LQPQCLISNNHHLSPIPGEDFQAFEKDLPGGNTTGFGGASVSQLPLETCETMNDAWGYNMTDRRFKSTKTLVHYMVNAAGLNANFLLNVGPMPNGKIQREFVDTLALVGRWMSQFGNSIYGTRGNVVPAQQWGTVTAGRNELYAHILNRPAQQYIFIPQVKGKISSVSLMRDRAALRFKQQDEGVFVYLDGVTLDDIDTVVELKM